MKKIMFNDRYGLTQAVLEGRKTMTRRIVSIPDTWHGIDVCAIGSDTDKRSLLLYDADEFLIEDRNTGLCGQVMPLYKVGEAVAVAQAYRDIPHFNPDTYEDVMLDNGTICEASHPYSHLMRSGGWDNKMFVRADLMPHRIEMTDHHVERMQSISEEDCLKEGIYEVPFCEFAWEDNGKTFKTAREAFAALIDKISGKGTWESNPWVFVYTFELVK